MTVSHGSGPQVDGEIARLHDTRIFHRFNRAMFPSARPRRRTFSGSFCGSTSPFTLHSACALVGLVSFGVRPTCCETPAREYSVYYACSARIFR